MAKTVLIITVGGSHEPILRSLEQNRPDYVCFLCSGDLPAAKGSYTQVTGEGKVLRSSADQARPDLPNIATLASLPADAFEVRQMGSFDDLGECYAVSVRCLQEMHAKHPDALLVADYTGGTKSMSAGLAAAALDNDECDLRLVSGTRRDLTQVRRGTEFVRPAQVCDARAGRRALLASQLVARFDYAGAARILEDAACNWGSPTTLALLQRRIMLCRAFDAWDRFDHAGARDLLRACPGAFVRHQCFLGLLLEGSGHGFELVQDLVRNAERRAAQERYDDAVGRLYRAVELTAQTWLQLRYAIDTSNVDVEKAPAEAREWLYQKGEEKGRVHIALWDAWRLVAAFHDDPLSSLFGEKERVLQSFLEIRNQALFAHGRQPVGRRRYKDSALRAADFVWEACGRGASARGRRYTMPEQLPAALD